MKKLASVILIIATVISMLSLSNLVSYSAAKDDYAYDCVAYAKARFREVWGFDLHATGLNEYGVYGASGYYYNAGSNGDTISSTPKTGALAVWGGSNANIYGHVAIVESVNGSSVTYSEGGYDGHFNQETRNTSNMSKTNQPFLGYVYVNGTGLEKSYVDIGDDFYGVILNKVTWKPITCDIDGFIRMGKETGTANQLWYFDRQSDGSYVITSAATGKALEMYNGDTTLGNPTAAVSTYWGGNYQKWNIYEQDGGYILASKHYPEMNLVLDMYNGDSSDGTSVVTWSSNNTYAQLWSIYVGNECQLQAPTLSVIAGKSSTTTTFTWSEVYGESQYNLKIYKNSVSSVNIYMTKTNVTSGYSVNLPAGKYVAVVEAVNYYQTKSSSAYTFTVEDDGTTIPNIDETQWVYVSAVPSHVTTDKYEIEYNNIYKKTATTSPDSSWTKGELVKTEYVNDGSTYESDFELSTSSTRVLVNYYYYHWCGSSTGNYVNFAYTDSFNHYDAYPEPNAVIEESSVADSDDSRYIAYKLAWAHDPSGHCYCAPALTCDSSNSHTTRSCWWYKRYIYQNKTAVKYYEFTKESGWSEQKDSSADAVEYRYKLIDGYTVSYNANGGSGAPSSQTKTTGQSITLSSTKPTRSGYTFKCWNTKADGTGTNYYSGGSYSADANLTLYAQWTENTTTQFKVTYNANGGTSILQYEYAEEGSTITLTTPFKYFKLNYDANGGTNAPSTSSLSVDCLGWASSSTATSAAYKCGASYMPTSNVTLYAVWKNSVRTNLSSQKPVREGYTFLGWALDPNASEAQFSAGETVDVSGDATLYAVWGTESAKTGYSFWEWIIIIVFFGWIWYV